MHRFFLLLAMVLFLSGCSVYTASSGRVDDNIKRVYVEYLENMTAEPNLGVDISDIIIRAIQVDNTLKIVDESSSDSIISGKVLRYKLQEVFARENLTVNEYQVQIAVVLDFRIRSTGEALFSNKRFIGSANYNLDDANAPEGVATDETSARSEAVDQIVRDILAQVVEEW
ncbi:MAG: hypothetical protein GY780_02830 [bacterium]|nr:hypothetical protein [bacterium]